METDDETPVRRTTTPLGRLDDQRAGFSIHSHAQPSPPLGKVVKPVLEAAPRPRPSPKSAGSASLPALTRYDSWEQLPRPSADTYGRGGHPSSGAVRRASTRRIVEDEADEGGPFSDFARKDGSWSTRSETSSTAAYTPYGDWRRRGSEFSTSSVLSSHSPQSHTFPPRRSSTATSFKGTIGHESTTSSMPLLRRHGTRESLADSESPSRGTSGGGGGGSAGGAGTPTTRRHRDSTASFSQSESSSLHSYPPKPRQRTGSLTMGVTENDFATGHIQRRGSADSRTDAWPSYVGSTPIAKPSPSYQSALSSYSFPAMPFRALGMPAPPSAYNPLAPLRKRLARSLAVTVGARELHTEVQLLLELIDALETCIATFGPSRADWSGPRRASTDSAASSVQGLAGAKTPLTSVAASPTPTTAEADKVALVDEVRLLVSEVVELVPAAQRCLTDGGYGPLAAPAPSVSTRALLEALEHPSPPQLVADPEWWPRKLARDCRSLLDEAGLPTGQGSATQTVWALATRLSEEADARPSPSSVAPPASSPTSPASSSAFEPRGTRSSGPGPALSDARRDELLLQGKARWEEFRERQSHLEHFAPAPV
ncbi:uncharacterized protein RHOBADRAFT_50715 [Rhodotorula graminis WP1]|uniref:Uncharacterized protein n=1 Tax=Rhodotorula graminis (strain WP1) TaxID=578459 RepID=A0A194SF76_RHOGW|nr:uncharacterized protein RHOBADRAFT_50715 [Rhodotorula graminis WP1]KPV78221.1 hypothetical protein RHOBADRAFT_50715 [Rhodotorula graminis WP1]